MSCFEYLSYLVMLAVPHDALQNHCSYLVAIKFYCEFSVYELNFTDLIFVNSLNYFD
jgi:hypothetical protein